jgi:ribosomal protein S18 acetylase RimI-like enzyme
MLAVAPEAQGQGVGMALAEMVVERFRADGANGIALSSLESMSGAHRIYDRLGFHRDADRDWSPAPGVHLIAYRLEL